MLDYEANTFREYKGNYQVWWKSSFLLPDKYMKDSSKNKINLKSFSVILRGKKENMATRAFYIFYSKCILLR